MSRTASARASTAILALVLVAAGCTSTAAPMGRNASQLAATNEESAPIRIGAVFPIEGNAAGLARDELAGVRIAAELVNADGGIDGRPIVLDVHDLESGADATAVMAALRAEGATVVVGAYSSGLSIAASTAAADAGLVYWEAGAVADRLTGRGLPTVFRVGASGANLGANSATFAATELAPRLGRAVSALRVAIVAAQDDYARSVADAAAGTTTAAGAPIVARLSYNLAVPDWPTVMRELGAARPDVIILASHIPDGIAFRRAMLAAGLRVGALIGSTMAECDPDFAGELGADAVGIFASDRPTAGFDATALGSTARAVVARFEAALAAEHVLEPTNSAGSTSAGGGPAANSYGGGSTPEYGAESSAGQGGAAEYSISGPAESGSADAGEEALAGFSAAWALFRYVLPAASGTGSLDAVAISSAARNIDLPVGTLPNGAGLRFSSDPATLGQNVRAAAVIWQWQAARTYAFVWPPTYATGSIAFVPLQR